MAKKSVKARLETEKTVKSKASESVSAKTTAGRVAPEKVKQPAKNSEIKPVEKPKRAKRKPHQTRPTTAELPDILERQNLVMDLKTNGVSFRRIEKRLKELGHDVSLGTVHADYVASLERLQALNINKTKFHCTQELEKIEDSEFELNALKNRPLTVLEKVAVENTKISLRNQRIKLLGLDKPKVIKIQSDSEFAKMLGINPDQLPDEDGDELDD